MLEGGDEIDVLCSAAELVSVRWSEPGWSEDITERAQVGGGGGRVESNDHHEMVLKRPENTVNPQDHRNPEAGELIRERVWI